MNQTKRLLGIAFLIVMLFWCTAYSESSPDQGFSSQALTEHGLSPDGAYGIQSVVMLEDVFYGLVNNGNIVAWNPKTQAHELFYSPSAAQATTQPLANTTLHSLVSGEDGSLYGLDALSGTLWQIASGGTIRQKVALPPGAFLPDGSPRKFLRCLIQENVLYLLADESEKVPGALYPQCVLLSISLKDGSHTSFGIDGIRDMCLYRTNTLLLLRTIADENQSCLVLTELDLNTKKVRNLTTEMPKTDARIAGLAYQSSEDTLYYANDASVMASLSESTFSPVASLSLTALDWNAPGWMLQSGEYAVFSFGIAMADIQAGTDPGKTLIIAAPNREDKLWDSFLSIRPEVSLLLDAGELSAAQIGERIRNGDTQTDLFQIRVDSSFRAFLDKGYAADLSASEMLTKEITSLYPALTTVLTDAQGKPLAYPISLSTSLWQVHAPLWEFYFPNEPIPSSYPAFFAAMLRFEEEHGAQGETYFIQDFNYENMVERVLAAYIQSYAQENQPLTFALPALRDSMETLARVESLRTSRGHISVNEAVMNLADEELIPYLFTPYGGNELLTSSRQLQNSPWQTLFPFVFEEGANPIARGYLSVMAVNPNSQRQELARQFLENAATMETNPQLYYSLHPDINQPLPKPEGQARVRSLEERKDQLLQAIQNAEAAQTPPAELPDMKEDLTNVERLLESQNMLLWIIPPEGLADYRQLAPSIRFFETAPFAILTESAAYKQLSDSIQLYCQGKLTLSDFLKRLETMMKMLYNES